MHIYVYYSDPSFNAGVRGIDHGVLGQTALSKFLVEKKVMQTQTYGHPPPPRLPKIHTYLGIKYLQCFGRRRS
jgi:hypothetical protein